ncbi:uncharacterized protein LOC111622233 [Centruroides sculpturatus]|uniref:uncharacterized protein LOC111622233 n=1 Tax=Centruroides sculpturatus TaxID=218467 RepID=UPI000C6DAF8E|nr:uncharacterized protein LOC111622233 [Centruroides sculpturatus]
MIERTNLIEHISRNTWGLGPKNARLIYKGAIEPGILYGVQVWGEALEKNYNKKKLTTIQRKAAIRICRAYRTSPTDALLVMAKLKPIHLAAKDIIWERSLIKGKNKFKTEEQITTEIKKGQLPDNKQLIKTIIENDTEDIDKTTIIANPAEKETYKIKLNYKEATDKRNIINIYTDGSRTSTGVGSGIIIKGKNGNTMYQGSFKIADYCTTVQAETFAIYKALDHIYKNKNHYRGELNIHTDSQTALSILKTKNRKTKLTNELIQISEKIQRIRNITFSWIPGHQGHKGNEMADELAKRATRTDINRIYTRIPIKEIKKQIKNITEKIWQQEWTTSTTGRNCFKYFPNIKDRLQNKVFNLSFGITQCITNHGNFKAYLHRFKKIDNPYCDIDTTKEDNAHHYLMECTKFNNQRETFIEKCLRAGHNWPPRDTDLVTDKNLFKALEKYINDTKVLIEINHKNKHQKDDRQNSDNKEHMTDNSEEEEDIIRREDDESDTGIQTTTGEERGVESETSA